MASLSQAKKLVTFKAKAILKKPIHLTNDFKVWFASKDTPLRILSLNPGISKIEIIDDSQYNAYLSPLQFPGISITSIMDFNVAFDGSSLEVKCNDDNLKQEFQGSKVLKNLISRLLPKVNSYSKFFIDEENRNLVNDAMLEIKFGLPKWFPFKKETIEKNGSETIQKQLENDMKTVMSEIIKSYEAQNAQFLVDLNTK